MKSNYYNYKPTKTQLAECLNIPKSSIKHTHFHRYATPVEIILVDGSVIWHEYRKIVPEPEYKKSTKY